MNYIISNEACDDELQSTITRNAINYQSLSTLSWERGCIYVFI